MPHTPVHFIIYSLLFHRRSVFVQPSGGRHTSVCSQSAARRFLFHSSGFAYMRKAFTCTSRLSGNSHPLSSLP